MISRDLFLRRTPLSPPTVNRKINPSAHRTGTSRRFFIPNRVATQEKIFTPVGTAIVIVAAVK